MEGPADAATEPIRSHADTGPSLRNLQAAHLIDLTRGEYEILRELGHGAMGAVYLARDVALSRRVAIKVIAPNLLADETMVSRFRLEAQTVASLRHPNIVDVYAVRQAQDLHYFVMEFISGPTLRSIVKRHAPLDIEVVQGILFQVGSALSYAHRTGRGVIHRDIKPANIMLDHEGDAFVTDFGISKVAESQSGLTRTGVTIGTPEYMSPEQCRGETLTGASDQYTLGIVAYEMLCGPTPFSGSTYSVLMAHTTEEPRPVRALRPDCPARVAEAVERMLAKAPGDRWPDLDSAVTALGGQHLGYQHPTRFKIVALVESTQSGTSALDTASPLSPVPGGVSVARAPTSISVTGIPSVVEPGDMFSLEADVRGSGDISLTGLDVQWTSTDPSIARVDGGRVEALRSGPVAITAAVGSVTSSIALMISDPALDAVPTAPAPVAMPDGGRIAQGAQTVGVGNGSKRRRPAVLVATVVGVVAVGGAAGVWAMYRFEEPEVDPGPANVVGADVPSSPEAAEDPPTNRDVVGPDAADPLSTQATRAQPEQAPSSVARPETPPADDPAPETAPEPEPVATAPIVPAVVVVQLPRTSMEYAASQVATAQVFATAGPTMQPGTYTLSWRSSDPSVVAVDEEGTLTAVGAGTAWIGASAGDARDSVEVSVSVAVVIEQPDFSLDEGASRTLTAAAFGVRRTPFDREAPTWRSSEPTVARADASSGEVTALSVGTAEIIATIAGFEDRITVTVEPATPDVPTSEALLPQLERYVGRLSDGDADGVRAIWGAGDVEGLEELLELMDERDFAAELGTIGDPGLQGDLVVVTFQVAATYRSFAGTARERELTFVAELRPSGSGWLLASCAMLPGAD